MRVFLSYGHDEHAAAAVRLKNDLEARGHEVWFDLERLRPGADWEAYIQEGLTWAAENPKEGRLVLLMTPHSVRRPDGFCLNELAEATRLGLEIVPVMLVSCVPPLSICRLQSRRMKPVISRSFRGCLRRWRKTALILRGSTIAYFAC